jgi:hypothetical protein
LKDERFPFQGWLDMIYPTKKIHLRFTAFGHRGIMIGDVQVSPRKRPIFQPTLAVSQSMSDFLSSQLKVHY